MDIKQIECFIAVAETLNFTTAAERMYLSQPALSRHIQNLETELGLALFVRNKRNVVLSNSGVMLLAIARSITNDANEFMNMAHKITTGEQGNLKLGYQTATAPVVTDYVKEFVDSYPNMNITIDEYEADVLMQKIISRELDTAIVFSTGSSGFESDTLVRKEIYNDELVLFLGREKFEHYKEKKKTEDLELVDFKKEAFLMVNRSSSSGTYDFLMDIYKKVGGSHKFPAKQPEKLSVLMMMLEANMGIALLPKHTTLAIYPEAYCIRLRDIDFKMPIELLWNNNNKNPTLRLFLDLFRE